MNDLVTFLRARLDEDEAVARTASPGPWRYNPRKQWNAPPQVLDIRSPGEEFIAAGPTGSPVCVAATGPADEPQSMADAAHIARWEPARVLAEVAAKRAIVLMAERTARESDDYPGWEGAVFHLAQPYADHPDFDPAWRPVIAP